MTVFWRDGYEGSSCDQLLQAMGINCGSMYAAFGDKHSLYSKSLELYADQRVSKIEEVLQAPGSPLGNLREFWKIAEAMATNKDFCGCLITNTLIEFGDEPSEIGDQARRIVKQIQSQFEKCLSAAKEQGELKESADPTALAAFMVSSLQGLAVMGRMGADPKMVRGSIATILGVLE